jgi:hypothetical protein
MLSFLKRLLMFRIGQKAAKGFARGIGLGRIAPVVGLIAGAKSMRRHS